MSDVIDFETGRRQRDLSNSQPLVINWVAVASYSAALLLSLAIWRGLYWLVCKGWRPW